MEAVASTAANVQLCTQATSAQHAIDLDLALLETAMASGDLGPHVRLWQNAPCLVVPRHFAKKPGFDDAQDASSLPIVLRRSGGMTAIHGPDFLNISVAQRLTARSAQAAYAPLFNILTPAFAHLGLAVTAGPVPGSYCDGAFNIVAYGKKLGGTSAIIRSKQDQYVTLAHATVHLAFEEAHLLSVTSLEKCLGLATAYDPEAHTALTNLF